MDREEFQSDYYRLVTERVSKEVCVIRASTNGEVNLLRYYLRVNSTRMRRSAWQSKNLPRGEDTPWIATFLSPLYEEMIDNNCRNLSKKEIQQVPILKILWTNAFSCHYIGNVVLIVASTKST